jgi:hypothetical protein
MAGVNEALVGDQSHRRIGGRVARDGSQEIVAHPLPAFGGRCCSYRHFSFIHPTLGTA